MMISSRGRYALRVMLDMAKQHSTQNISVRDLAARQNISRKYLESIMTALCKANLIESETGKDGGYRLARSPQEYTVAEIVRLAEGTLAPVSCLECTENACERADSCLTLPVWQRLDELIDAYLSGVTIADLVAGSIPAVRLQWLP
mgnify:CR=1 FL=1